jgi:NAD(P)-dependent dehydrogenase (short-subunit alcohol dehydrogenase family)
LGRLANKVCVIAGAAGVIGEATAGRLRREGATVVGVDQRAHSVGVLSVEADLTAEAEVERTFARIYQEFGRIDVLFNNAGLNDPDDHSALDMTQETWDRVFAANLTTTFLSCKHGIPYLLRNDPPSGSVINTASFLAVMGAATSQMAYSAAKAAVIQLSRDLGTHLARRGCARECLVSRTNRDPAASRAVQQASSRGAPEAAHPLSDGALWHSRGTRRHRGVPRE